MKITANEIDINDILQRFR